VDRVKLGKRMEDPCGKLGDTFYKMKDNISLQWKSPSQKWKALTFILNVSSKYTRNVLANI
jgi:hypothetical protein